MPEGPSARARTTALDEAGIYFRPGKIIQASKNLGVGMAAFERTAEYVQSYVQGGRILIKHQAVALRLADMATKLAAVRALLAYGRARGRRSRARRRCALQHGEDLRVRGSVQGVPARDGAARRQRRDARLRHREAASATPPCSCTWTRPPTSRASRSSRRCFPRRPAPTPGRSSSASPLTLVTRSGKRGS